MRHGWIARTIGVALTVGLLAAPAVAIDPAEQARWQTAADTARVPLLVPDTGLCASADHPRSLSCGGDTLGQAFATWSSADGRLLYLVQGRPFACGEGPESTLISEVVISGKTATYSRYDGEPETTWMLHFERDGALTP